MEVHRFYTFMPIQFTNLTSKQKNIVKESTFYVRKAHSAYVYSNTYTEYYNNLNELWSMLSNNYWTKLETIEDHEDETCIVYFDMYCNIHSGDTILLHNCIHCETHYNVDADYNTYNDDSLIKWE